MKYSFDSFNNTDLEQTITPYIFNSYFEIPFFHPTVSWNKNTYKLFYYPLLKKEFIVEKCRKRSRILKQYDMYGNITWFSKQIIIDITNDYIVVKEYDMLNNGKIIGIVKYNILR